MGGDAEGKAVAGGSVLLSVWSGEGEQGILQGRLW
jgi:hypothetical protein